MKEKTIYLSGLTAEDLANLFGNVIETKLAVALDHLKTKPETELITRKDVAALLGVSLPTVREYTLSGKLIGFRIGHRIRYKKSDVEAALQQIHKS